MPVQHPCDPMLPELDGMEIFPGPMTLPTRRSTPVASHLRRRQSAESHLQLLGSQVQIARSVQLIAFPTHLWAVDPVAVVILGVKFATVLRPPRVAQQRLSDTLDCDVSQLALPISLRDFSQLAEPCLHS